MEATQQCGECQSPLRPCKCERNKEYIVSPGPRRPLGVRKRLKSRTLTERFAYEPWRYGELFKAVRVMSCFGKIYLKDMTFKRDPHRCAPGFAPPSAHHLGDTDLDGMVPVCGDLHDRCELTRSEVEYDLSNAGSPSLDELGRLYVEAAVMAVLLP